MYKQDLKINFGKLEAIASDLKSYRKSLNKVSKVNQRFIKELNKEKSEGIKALQVKYNQLQVEIEDCIEELKDLEDIFTDYCEDMTAILPPINRNELMHVGKADVKANLLSIDFAYRSAEVLKTMTSMQDSPGFWLSEEEKEEEKRKMRNNYQKMESIRTVDIVNLVNELNAQKTELWSLFHNKISAFEDKDDEYRTKANKLYKKYTNTVEYVKEKGKWLVWDLPVEFDKGVLSNLGNTIKGLLIDPYVKSVTVKAALFDWAKAKITGAEDSLGEQYIKNEIETGKMLLKDPFLIVEGIAQESSDTVENKGIAYASGYVGMEVVKAVLLKKIAAGEISAGKASAGVNLVDDVAEGAVISDNITGMDWYKYFQQKYGKGNVCWENVNPVEMAKLWQGNFPYVGIDDYELITLHKGDIIYIGEPFPTGYSTTAEAIKELGDDASSIFKGLQVKPYWEEGMPYAEYRNIMMPYEVQENISVASGIAKNNLQFGEGGISQMFDPNFDFNVNNDLIIKLDDKSITLTNTKVTLEDYFKMMKKIK